MYVDNYPILVSIIEAGEVLFAKYDIWHSNGSRVRSNRGELFLGTVKKDTRIHYVFETDYGKHEGFITDKLIVARLIEYMDCFYNKKHTNCSALAYFLTTGTFIECQSENRALLLPSGMRVYNGQRVEVGDMVCIFFGQKQKMRSRKNILRSDWRKISKNRHKDRRFGHSLPTKHQTFTAEQIRHIYRDSRVEDFHFMVCVAICNGEPVWIAQRGRFRSGEVITPLVLTVGFHDCYDGEVPLLTLLKKRR